MREEHLKEIKQVLADAAAALRAGAQQEKTAAEQAEAPRYVIDLAAFRQGAGHA